MQRFQGSASLTPFADAFPGQFVELGIAEQNLVSVSADLRNAAKTVCGFSGLFLSTRSYEQCKIDVAYSDTNVKLIGISGGISYGALGMSHHSAQDIAAMSAIPNMRVYLPSDRFQTKKLFEALLKDDKPAYIRVGRNPVEDIYEESECPFELDRANVLCEGTGYYAGRLREMVYPAYRAAQRLKEEGIEATVIDMYCIKPLDTRTVIRAAQNTRAVLTVEEHAPSGGLGAAGCTGRGSKLPKTDTKPDTSGCTGDHRHIERSI